MRLVWLSRTKFLSADNSLKGYLNSFCCVDERKSVKLIYGISAEKRGQSSNSFPWAKAVSKRKKNACVPGSQSQGFDTAPAQPIRDPFPTLTCHCSETGTVHCHPTLSLNKKSAVTFDETDAAESLTTSHRPVL